MRQCLILLSLLLATPPSIAYQWSANEYVDNCSIVYHKQLSAEDMSVSNYCMGVMKGAATALLYLQTVKTGDLKIPECMTEGKNPQFWSIQKNVVAQVRLNNRTSSVAHEPNTANAAVVKALTELYPCLVE